jgi:hypothetical protein
MGRLVTANGTGEFEIGAPLKITRALAPVPEASTWAMMLLGFGGLGFAARRGRGGVPASVPSIHERA